MSVRVRAHLTSWHGPVTPEQAFEALGARSPAWMLDVNGRVLAANRMALWLWGLEDDQFQGVDVFQIFADNVERIPAELNPTFWKAKFRIETLVENDGPSVFDRLRNMYPELQRMFDDMRVEKSRDDVWQYVLKIGPPEGAQHNRMPKHLTFRTTVSAVIAYDNTEYGFLAQYSPDSTTDFILNELSTTAGAPGDYILPTSDALPMPTAPSTIPESPSIDVRSEPSILARLRERSGTVAPASRKDVLLLSVLTAAAMAAAIAALVAGLVAAAPSGLALLLAATFSIMSIGALLLVVRAAFFRSQYLAEARSILLDLTTLRAIGEQAIPRDDRASTVLFEELIDEGRRLRDGLLLSQDRQLASDLNAAAYAALNLSQLVASQATAPRPDEA